MSSNYNDFYKPRVAQRNGLRIAIASATPIGVGGVTVAPTATTSVLIPVGRVKVSALSFAIEALTAAAGSAAITVQAFKVSGGVSTALTAATSIKNDVITAAGNFALPVTSSLFDGAGNATRVIDGTNGDTIRVDVVAAGTVTTAPSVRVTAELAVKE